MNEIARLKLIDVLVNRQLLSASMWSRRDMGTFYLTQREGGETEASPHQGQYFDSFYRKMITDSRTQLVAPGFNGNWICIGTLIPEYQDAFTYYSSDMLEHFDRPGLHGSYNGVVAAVKEYSARSSLPSRSYKFVAADDIFSLGKDVSTFIRRHFDEMPDKADEEEMMKMFEYVILRSVGYVLNASIMPGSGRATTVD